MIIISIAIIIAVLLLIAALISLKAMRVEVTGRKHNISISYYDEETTGVLLEIPNNDLDCQSKDISVSVELPLESPLDPLCDAMLKEAARLSYTASERERDKIRAFLLEAAKVAAPMWEEQQRAVERELVEILSKHIPRNGGDKPKDQADNNV